MGQDKFKDLRNGDVTNEEIMAAFLADKRLEGCKEGTLAEYHRRLAVYYDFLKARQIRVSAVTHDDIHDFINAMHAAGKKNQTKKNTLSTIYVFTNWGVKNGLWTVSPLTKADFPVVVTARIHRLTDDQLQELAGWLSLLQENLRAAFWLMIGTGARVGEVAHLTAQDVTIRDGAVYVAIHDAKWGSDRVIPITEAQAAAIVWKYRQTVPVDGQPLFRLSRRTLQFYATKFAQTSGIPFHCHLLRHTYAARLTEQGVPITTIQYLLGHKSVAMTAHYTQSALVDLSGITPTIDLGEDTQ